MYVHYDYMRMDMEHDMFPIGPEEKPRTFFQASARHLSRLSADSHHIPRRWPFLPFNLHSRPVPGCVTLSIVIPSSKPSKSAGVEGRARLRHSGRLGNASFRCDRLKSIVPSSDARALALCPAPAVAAGHGSGGCSRSTGYFRSNHIRPG